MARLECVGGTSPDVSHRSLGVQEEECGQMILYSDSARLDICTREQTNQKTSTRPDIFLHLFMEIDG